MQKKKNWQGISYHPFRAHNTSFGFSYYVGAQVVTGSTHLSTNENTKNVHKKVWEYYAFDFDDFQSKYSIEKLELQAIAGKLFIGIEKLNLKIKNI